MSIRTRSWSLLAGAAFALSLVGAPTLAASPSPTDPVATMNAMLDTIAAMDFAGVGPLVCEAHRAEAEAQFTIDTSTFAGLPETVDVQAFIDGLTFTIDPRSVTLISNDGTNAQVDVQATLTVGVEDAAARTFVKQLLESQGQEASDPVIDAVMPELMSQIAKTQDLSNKTEMLFENGVWTVCDSLGANASPGPSGAPAASPAASPAA